MSAAGNATNKSPRDLPDYAALKKLAAALWQQDSAYHGAAVMVGAGFSRAAASTGDINKKMPLWNDFSNSLAEELDSKSADPLRLAEEYCAYFGKQALHDLIKNKINDAAWVPSTLHKSLLELPWSEVLTTNWDTLLERASEEVHQPVYSLVSKQEDLSSARAPRIVKLHGTINITKELIFTQEDYRKYPQHCAAFVNFARQVFIENELCLLGFSGDDPNFLQWAGWVRDHLSAHSRRIYLVGALGLNSAKRKYLESINVAPIDLDELVTNYDDCDIKHLEATKIFLQTLQDLKPELAWEWSPTTLNRTIITGEESTRVHKDPAYAAKLLEEKLPALEQDRISYPGWLVCPYPQRFKLQSQINDPWPSPKNLSAMTEDCRAKLLYEISWQHGITYEVVSPWLIKELLTICDPDKPCILTKQQQLEVALLLLKNTRWLDDKLEAESVAQITSSILESNRRYWVESSNELAYHSAMVARDKFDYQSLEEKIEKISVSSPIWKLRKASLLAEIGLFDEGAELISEAYRELLGQYRKDRNSIYILSRLAWANWLKRGVELWLPKGDLKAFPSIYQEQKCSPWDHIEHIRDRISKELDKQKQQAIEPSFEPGRYKDGSNKVVLNNELHPLFLLDGISNTTGVPLHWNNTSFFAKQAASLAEFEDIDSPHRFTLAIRAASSDTSDILNKVFSRIRIASIPKEEIDVLFDQTKLAISYWSKKWITGSRVSGNHAIDRLRIFIEVLARISIRATVEQAKEAFYLAISLGTNPQFQHLWLFSPLNHLINFSLKSIPEQQHHELLLDALLFPLQTEIKVDGYNWPNPVVNFPGCREKNTTIDHRIDKIIESLVPDLSQGASAILRLLPLIENNFLTSAECNKIAKIIWGITPDYQSIPETGLFKFSLLHLPTHDITSVKSLIRCYLFESKDGCLFNNELLMDIINSAHSEKVMISPSDTQALDYFEKMVAWRVKKEDNNLIRLFKENEQQTAGLIGKVLAKSIVPALSSEALNEENFQRLYAFYTEVRASETIMAFPYFTVANSSLVIGVERLIRQGLQSREANSVAYASYALLKWKELSNEQVSGTLISRVIYLIESGQRVGLQALLWTVNQMYLKGYLSEEHVASLTEAVPAIFDDSSYINIFPNSREAVSISLVRAACVRLARDILNKNQGKNRELLRILEEAKQDALPEVRFAELTDI